MRICLFEQQFTSKTSIQQNPEKSMKNQPQKPPYLAIYTKSDISTMETIPNCTKLHCYFRRKITQNQLHVRFFCGILEQNRMKKRAVLYISIMNLPILKFDDWK